MKCPVCNLEMIVLECHRVEIDYCLDCRGIWLDRGELELLFNDSAKALHALTSFGKRSVTGEKRRKCPICRKSMDKLSCPERPDIIIDGCPDSDGLWFDRQELYELLQSLEGASGEAVAFLGDNFFKDREK